MFKICLIRGRSANMYIKAHADDCLRLASSRGKDLPENQKEHLRKIHEKIKMQEDDTTSSKG